MSELTREDRQARLYAAVVRASKSAAVVLKGSENNHQGYKYASSEHVILTAKQAMEPEGLAVIPTSAEIIPGIEYEKNDNNGRRTVPMPVLKRCFLLIHEDGGEMPGEMAWPLEINRGKGVDKAAGSAETTCFAYYLRSLLQLPRLASDDMNFEAAAKGESVTPSINLRPPQVTALLDRVRSINSADKFRAAERHVSRIADALAAGEDTPFTQADVDELRAELEKKA